MHLTKDHIVEILQQTDCKIEEFNNFIETGTYLGDTILSMYQHFKKNYTIEIKMDLYYSVVGQCSKRGVDNINCYFGDSAVILKDVLTKEVDNKSIFYLDAHYSGGRTGRGSKDTPLLEELKLINKYHNFDSVIIIDDFQEFGIKNKIINWEDITVDHVLDCFDDVKVVKSFSIKQEKSNRFIICLKKLNKKQSDKNILCTGGIGFIGSNIVDKLVNLGHHVTVIDNLSTGKMEYLNPKAEFIQADIRSSQIIQIIQDLDNIDAIIHTAAKGRVQPSLKIPIDYHNNNVTGTLNLLEACRLSDIPKFIYSSSSSVYGDSVMMAEDTMPNPTSPYALTKYLGELYCKMYSDLYGIKTICLRYFNVYGNRGCDDLVLGIFTKQKLEGKPLTVINDGSQRRDFTFVGDVVDANIRSIRIELDNDHEIINIGNSGNRSIIEIARLFNQPMKFIGKQEEPKETKALIGKANMLLGWKPTTKIEDWFEEYKKIFI